MDPSLTKTQQKAVGRLNGQTPQTPEQALRDLNIVTASSCGSTLAVAIRDKDGDYMLRCPVGVGPRPAVRALDALAGNGGADSYVFVEVMV